MDPVLEPFVLNHETAVRLTAFGVVLAAFMGLEALAPRRPRRDRRARRWTANLAMVGLGALAMRLAVPLMAVEAALRADAADWGLFNWLALAPAVEIVAAVILLDLVVYAQHRLFHRVPLLWRLHAMHHTDLDLDATSGVRFHPLEYVLSMAIKVAAVWLLGAAALAVIAFELLLNATSIFNHSNLRLPAGWDRWLRLVVVTPDMHVVHHSTDPAEHNRNFGFNLPWWDRLFGTYTAAPRSGPVGLTIGLEGRQVASELGLGRLLWMPFERARRADASPQIQGDRSA